MHKPSIRLTTALCAAALAIGASSTWAVSLDMTQFDYLFKVKFTGYAGSTTLTDFPALVKISEFNGSGFRYANCAADGADLRFADAEGNLIPHEIDTWDPTGTSLVWVKVPSLNATTAITACYGYKGEDPIPAVTASDVWTNGYVAVWHLNAASDATTQTDSTANAIVLTEGPEQTQRYVTPGVAGAIGSCAQFGIDTVTNGCYKYEDTENTLAGFDSFTFELWSWQNDHDPSAAFGSYYMSHSSYERTDDVFRLQEYKSSDPASSGMTILYAYTNNYTATAQTYSNTKLPARAAWNYHAFAIDATADTRRVFLNDERIKLTSGQTGTLRSPGGYFWLGNSHEWDRNAFLGKMDEVRISNVSRSDDWMRATYDTAMTDGFAQYEEAALRNNWNKYARKFTVTFKNYTGTTTLTDFPVLVKLSASALDGFSYADFKKPNGGDLRFSDEAGNILPSEVDCWDTNGISCVWVKVPTLNANTKIRGYYGWAPAPDVDATAVWDSDYVAVWHLNGAATASTQGDSTENAITLTEAPAQTQAYVTPGVAGVVGTCAQFGIKEDKTGCYNFADSENKLSGFGAYTLEFWSWQDDHDPADNTGAYYMRHSTYARTEDVYRLQEFKSAGDARNGMAILYSYTTGGSVQTYDGTKVPARAAWNYQVFAIDSSARRFFLNDEKLKNSSGQTDPLITNTDGIFWLGNSHSWDGAAFPGKLDEVRISKVARSDDWIKATYDTIAGDLATIRPWNVPTRVIVR